MDFAPSRLYSKIGVILVAFTFVVVPPFAVAAEAKSKGPEKEETWCVLFLGGKRIGHMQSNIDPIEQDGKPVVKTTTIIEMKINRSAEPLVLNQTLNTLESAEGDLLSFRWEMANPPAMNRVTSGIVDGKNLSLTQNVNGTEKKTKQAWTAGVKSSVYQDRALKENPIRKGETRTFEYFNPEFSKIDKITFKGIGDQEVTLLNNKKQKLFKVLSTQSLLPGIDTESFLDEKGETIKVSQNVLGSTMEVYRATKAEALAGTSDEMLDLAISTMIKVKPILKGHDTKRVVYRVTIEGQNPADVLPSGDAQTVKKLDDRTAELTVKSIPIPNEAKISEVAEEYLESSQYLQKDDGKVKSHAEKAAGNATDPAEIARRMERYVHQKIQKKDLTTALASAAEVAKTMQGDCTEHAVLLAAMLRAKGIPSRVAIGFVYSIKDIAFCGHMWTEVALDGKWIPLDATLGEGGIGAAHIKLADASLSDKDPVFAPFTPLMTIVGKMKIDVVSTE